MSSDSTGPSWRLKDLSAGEYARLSELIDSCLALSPGARTDWLSRLEIEDVRNAEILRRLFATSGVAGLGSLLETGEALNRDLESCAREEETLIGRRVGPYRVLSLLGQGGMGSVWLAERADGLFVRQVALKLIHPGLMDRQVTERFAREREILASLSHPNIARLFDAGFTEEGQPFLALQYVGGRPITAYCDERQLTVHERLQLFLQVLKAVQYAHAHLIIHRDLKPSNILVTEEGEVQLLDFGIAKLLTAGDARETELTQLGGRALTPDYASPEQIAGQPITTAADVYALGVILYELLTGARPYRLKRDSRGALEEAILAAEPMAPSRALSERAAQARATTPSRLVKALRGDLDTIATKALKKSPADRYATANAFGEDIARFLRGEVVLAQRDSVPYRVLKFARRNRVLIAATAMLLLMLAGGLAATTWQAHVARLQADRAATVQDFVIGLFDAADPSKTQGRELTVRELVERGADDLQSKLAHQPQLKAALEGVLVELYSKIGDDIKALPLAEARRDLVLKSAGPDSVEYGDALFALAKVQGGIGRHDMAEETFRRATAVYQRHGQEREGALLVSERMRAFQLIKLHREAEARELLVLTLPKLEAHFGAQSWEVAQARDRLALAYALEGNHTRAAQMYDLLGPFMADPPAAHVLDAAVVREHQGVSLRLAGRLDAAENAISSAIATFDSRLGRYNPDSIAMQHQLGIVLTEAGRFAQAAQAFEGNVERAARVFGMHDPQTAMRESSRLPALIMLGRNAEAEVIGRQAVADADSKPGLSGIEALGIRRTLALALIFSGKPAEAADLLQQVGSQEQAAGDRSSRHATTLLYEAGARNALHQFKAATQLARQSATLLAGDPDSAVLLAKAQLTEALASAHSGDAAGAADAVLQAEVNLKRRLNPDHPDFLLVALVRAELRRASGGAAEAERVAMDARTRLSSEAGANLPESLPLIF